MIETMHVLVSGPAFSLLLHENVNSPFEQEGFLLGEIRQIETKTITDNEREVFKLERIIKVNSIYPCRKRCSFYDAAGRVDGSQIDEFLGEHKSKVIGWYKFRRAANFRLRLRDKIVHKELMEVFSVPKDMFMCCLLITQSNDVLSTHTFSQNFFRYNMMMYQPLPVHIVNLSDSNNTYQSAQNIPEGVNNIIKLKEKDLKKMHGLDVVKKIHNVLQTPTGKLIKEISAAEKRLCELGDELKGITEDSATLDNSVENGTVIESPVNASTPVIPTSSPESERKTKSKAARKLVIDDVNVSKLRTRSSSRLKNSEQSYSSITQSRSSKQV